MVSVKNAFVRDTMVAEFRSLVDMGSFLDVPHPFAVRHDICTWAEYVHTVPSLICRDFYIWRAVLMLLFGLED
jgi:hypothetical protein